MNNIELHHGIMVVRDDKIGLGGTKTRVIDALMKKDQAETYVYASPAEGSAQIALADSANKHGKKAVIFVAARKHQHYKTLIAESLGATIITVRPGYLNVVQARAKQYSIENNAFLIPFGGYTDEAIVITEAAKSLNIQPKEVWCSGGSGTLAKYLNKAWPQAKLNIVQVGKAINNPTAIIHTVAPAFSKAVRNTVPFTCDPYYETKAWEVCKQLHGENALFWNVAPDVYKLFKEGLSSLKDRNSNV